MILKNLWTISLIPNLDISSRFLREGIFSMYTEWINFSQKCFVRHKKSMTIFYWWPGYNMLNKIQDLLTQ